MQSARFAILDERGVLALGGAEARPFIQGLISNDIEKVGATRAIYATLLTPQGKFLHDFFVVALGEALLFDCEGARRADLERRLAFYRLRADVAIEAKDDFLVAALFGDGALAAVGLDAAEGHANPFAAGIVYTDPRWSAAGARAILPREGARQALEAAGLAPASADDYDRLRLAHALPDGSRDMAVEKGFVLENGLEALNGVDFDKGCYVGQELTARTKHRATLRKAIYRVDIDGPAPAPGTPITLDGRPAGEMRSSRDGIGLALLRIEMVEQAAGPGSAEASAPLLAGAARLTPTKPPWASPEPKK